ncbi:MAG: hypothetical protein DWQ06_16900 [Calditrichaeota bacterium]|nr:MAG: hypothetical protein DWQ06_16900 [Calditrichota bacterium]
MKNINRRDFIKLSAATGTSIAFMGIFNACEDYTFEPVTGGSEKTFITDIQDFYTQFGNSTTSVDNLPNVTKASWQLEISGLVDTPKTFSFSELEALASEHEMTYFKTMRCVFDAGAFEKYISNAYWTGVPLKVLLEQAGIQSSAKRLRIFGSDGFTNNILLSDVMKETPEGELPIILCYKMNGEELPLKQGFPVRVIFPEKFGFKNMKWISKIELTDVDEPFGVYEVDYGIFDDGDLKPISYITAPLTNENLSQNLTEGKYTVLGTALTGRNKPQKVEVRIDDGDWKDASIASREEVENQVRTFVTEKEGRLPSEFIEQFKNPDAFSYPFKNTWVVWKYDFEVTGTGAVKISARVTDETGFTQPEEDNTFDDGNVSIQTVDASKG